MALRASETFVVALKPVGKRIFSRNEVVPKEFAKGRGDLVYDDTKIAPPVHDPYLSGPRKPRAVDDTPDEEPVEEPDDDDGDDAVEEPVAEPAPAKAAAKK